MHVVVFGASLEAPTMNSVGGSQVNAALSSRCAEAEAQALAARGAAPQRIQSGGGGEDDPVADNATDTDGH